MSQTLFLLFSFILTVFKVSADIDEYGKPCKNLDIKTCLVNGTNSICGWFYNHHNDSNYEEGYCYGWGSSDLCGQFKGNRTDMTCNSTDFVNRFWNGTAYVNAKNHSNPEKEIEYLFQQCQNDTLCWAQFNKALNDSGVDLDGENSAMILIDCITMEHYSKDALISKLTDAVLKIKLKGFIPNEKNCPAYNNATDILWEQCKSDTICWGQVKKAMEKAKVTCMEDREQLKIVIDCVIMEGYNESELVSKLVKSAVKNKVKGYKPNPNNCPS